MPHLFNNRVEVQLGSQHYNSSFLLLKIIWKESYKFFLLKFYKSDKEEIKLIIFFKWEAKTDITLALFKELFIIKHIYMYIYTQNKNEYNKLTDVEPLVPLFILRYMSMDIRQFKVFDSLVLSHLRLSRCKLTRNLVE